MTVYELIKKLEELPKDLEVVVQIPQYWEGETDYISPDLQVDMEYNRVIL